MSEKSSTDVLIGGKVYTLAGFESKDYLQRVAAYLNMKISECEEVDGYKRLSGDMKSILLELNIADEYMKAKDYADQLDENMKARETEVYDIRHEIIEYQIKVENMEREIRNLAEENKKLSVEKARLEGLLKDSRRV